MNTEKIQNLIDSHKVIVFGKGEKGAPRCGFTFGMQLIFDEVYPEYEMVNILADDELRADLKEFSQWPTFPQIYIDGEFVGGGDIVQQMHEAGELQQLITKE